MAHVSISVKDPAVRAALAATFPNYKGRKLSYRVEDSPLDVTSFWDGGSRSYFVLLELATLRARPVPQNGTPYDGGPIRPNGVHIPEGYAIVEHVIFCGKDLGIRFHVGPSDSARFAPITAFPQLTA